MKPIHWILPFFSLLLSLPAAAQSPQSITIDGDTPWLIMTDDFQQPPIQEAIRDAERDWYKVFRVPPVVFRGSIPSHWEGPVLVLGSLENTREVVAAEVPEGAEQHVVQLTEAGNNPAIAAVGQDTRGTIYAIYTFSERVLGIDPMYIFTDHVPERREQITVTAQDAYVSTTPTFEHRGWFINDEELHDGMHRDPLNGNVISMEWMDGILETLLRTKGNMIAPESAPFPDATVYDLCQRRDVIIAFHHILPLGLNMMHWPEDVPFSYITHKDILEDAWRKSALALADKKVAWTIGFRGNTDGAFWHGDPAAPKDDQGRADVISAAMHKQVEIIREIDPDATIIAALWNELGDLYNRGFLAVPEGVTKMFADDGRGYMRDKGDGSDLDPGDGLYYHVMMMMNTQNRSTELVPPSRIYKELRRYVERGATTYAINNVSGIRPAVMSVQAMNDFLWNAEPYLSVSPEVAEKAYLEDWYGKQFTPELAEELAALRLHYYQIPYMREEMPEPYHWRGARGEHLLHYMTHELLTKYSDAMIEGDDISGMDTLDMHLRKAAGPLVETEEFFPALWEATQALESKIPEDRKAFYQAHFTYQVAVHMYSARMLDHVVQGFNEYLQDRAPEAFARNLKLALADLEMALEEAHKAEYGQWETMFMHIRLMDMWRTRLLLKKAIAQIEGEPYTKAYRGVLNGSFWGSAQSYFEQAEGTYPYFYEHTGRGLEVLESGEPLPKPVYENEPVETEQINDLSFNTENAYEVVPGGLRAGAALWTDRGYTVGKIPAELEGATLIRTPMEDRANPNAEIIRFTAKEDGTVYVGIKDEIRTMPEWLESWELTGLSIYASNELLLYKKNFRAGETVALGSILGSGVSAMYSVAVTGE